MRSRSTSSAAEGMDTRSMHRRVEIPGDAGGTLECRLQEMEEIIRQRPIAPSVDPVADLFAVQATGHLRVIAVSCLSTQTLRQVFCDCCPGLSHGYPSSLACLSAIEESEPQIKA